jgi:hypothetical protein
LRKASTIEATANYLGNEGYKNLQLYQELYDDLSTYYYAWFGFIFKEKPQELLQVCKTMSKFALTKLKMIDVTSDEALKIVNMFEEVKDLWQADVKEGDFEKCEEAGMLELDFHQCCYYMSLLFAKTKMEDDAEDYFNRAFGLETHYQYYDEYRYCAKVIEFATGKKFSEEELNEIEMSDAYSNGSMFYYKCLRAYISQARGSVPMINLDA